MQHSTSKTIRHKILRRAELQSRREHLSFTKVMEKKLRVIKFNTFFFKPGKMQLFDVLQQNALVWGKGASFYYYREPEKISYIMSFIEAYVTFKPILVWQL